MTISYKNSPEPFTLQSRTADPIVIESAGSRHLLTELRRYCDGEIGGRSFLIAGHRGAGKTTLVNSCVEQVVKETAAKPRRPLVIRLFGPSLVMSLDSVPAKDGKTKAGEDAAKAKGESKDDDGGIEALRKAVLKRAEQLEQEDREILKLAAQNAPEQAIQVMQADREKKADIADPELQPLQSALKQIVLALHRALSDEIVTSYRARSDQKLGNGFKQELREHAAQLQLELDKYATPDVLRRHWAAGEFLEKGVLFTASPNGDQGFRELVALAFSCEAYSRVSGNFSNAELKQSVSGAQTTEVGTGKSGVDLITPILSLLAGGVTGTAAFVGTDGKQVLPATFAGFVAAVGAATVFKVSASTSRKREFTQSLTFVPDLTIATLNRVVPTLVKRVQEAGLAPIIVIDELDKIPGLYTELDRIIRHIKNLITEDAFFCFLTDRDYFERITKLSVNDPYPRHFTYFTDRVFVSFQTGDMRKYVKERLQPQKNEQGEEDADDKHDLDALAYVAMRRSEMHAIELRRQLSAWRTDEGRLALNPGAIRFFPHYRHDLYLQIAIEQTLAEPWIEDRMRDNPAFSRLAHDALYYPMRILRRDGGRWLDLRQAKLGEFRKYLIERMSSEKGPEKPADEEAEYTVTDADAGILFELTRTLASMLEDRFLLLDAIDWNQRRIEISPILRDALPINPEAESLLRRGPERHFYEWRYDADFNPLPNLVGEDDKLLRRLERAYQLDTRYRLAVRLTLASPDRDETILRRWLDCRDEIERLLWLPYNQWLHQGVTEIDITSKAFTNDSRLAAPTIRADDRLDALHQLGLFLSNSDEYLHALRNVDWSTRYETALGPFQQNFANCDSGKWEFNFDREGYDRSGAGPEDRDDWQLSVQLINDFAEAVEKFVK